MVSDVTTTLNRTLRSPYSGICSFNQSPLVSAVCNGVCSLCRSSLTAVVSVLSNVGHHRVVTAVFNALCGLHSLLSLHSVNAPVCSLVSQASTSVKGCGFTSFPWSAVWSALVFNGLCSFPLCSLKWHSLVSAVSICLKSLQLSLYSCRKESTNSSCRIRSTAKDIWQMCSFKYQRT